MALFLNRPLGEVTPVHGTWVHGTRLALYSTRFFFLFFSNFSSAFISPWAVKSWGDQSWDGLANRALANNSYGGTLVSSIYLFKQCTARIGRSDKLIQVALSDEGRDLRGLLAV